MGLFYNIKGPRKFNHQPIFYDPKKEALEERVNKVKREMGVLPPEEHKPNFKGLFMEQSQFARKRADSPEKSNAVRNSRLFIILVLLLIAVYFFYIR